MEIKVGEYVRTELGTIGRVKDIDYAGEGTRYYGEELIKNYYTIDYNDDDYGRFDNNGIVKHSLNIIDLIEVGDYVNGYLINYIPNNEKAIYHDASDCEDVEKFENKDIKTIVTKEQFKEMEYRVNE